MSNKYTYRGKMLIEWDSFPSTSFDILQDSQNVIFRNMRYFINTYYSPKIIKEFRINQAVVNYEIIFYFTDGTSTIVSNVPIGNIANTLRYTFNQDEELEIICEVEYYANTEVLLNYYEPNVNCIFMYLLNSPKNKVSKDLIFVDCNYVQYTHPITNKSFPLQMKYGALDKPFNYVYLTVLHRYYYVTDKTMTNDIQLLRLQEDVLYSWEELIRYQEDVYVERNEVTYNEDKQDTLVNYDYDKVFVVTSLTPTQNIFPTQAEENTRNSCVVVTVAGAV